MPRTLGAVSAVTLVLAFPACAHGQAVERPDELLHIVADRSFELPAVAPLPRRKKNDWLDAVAHKLEAGRAALEGHALVITSGDSDIRTFSYEDAVKSVNTGAPHDAEARAATDGSLNRLRLDLPKQPNVDGDLKVRFTGGVDEVGVLLSKKM